MTSGQMVVSVDLVKDTLAIGPLNNGSPSKQVEQGLHQTNAANPMQPGVDAEDSRAGTCSQIGGKVLSRFEIDFFFFQLKLSNPRFVHAKVPSQITNH